MGDPPAISIAGRRIGPDEPPFVIAELSGNHNGSLDRALALIDAAAQAGADAVKVQTYTPDTITLDCDRPEFRIAGGLWDGRTLHQLYDWAHTPWDWMAPLFRRAAAHGLICFSSPFDDTAVDLLVGLDAPAYKIASFEVVDHALIRRCAGTGRPLIISTGMASLGEIVEAVQVARTAGAAGIALLHCTSGYPTPPSDSNLRTIPHLAGAFGVPVGLSDHTPGIAVPVAAVALGATIIEKHLTLARADGGPDAAFSLEPPELVDLVAAVRVAWEALGAVRYERAASEQANAQFRRSLYAVADIEAGERLTAANVRSIRPGLGLAPRFLEQVLGRCARQAIARGTPLDWSLLA